MNEKMEEKIENDYHGFFLGNNVKEPVGNLNERWTDAVSYTHLTLPTKA